MPTRFRVPLLRVFFLLCMLGKAKAQTTPPNTSVDEFGTGLYDRWSGWQRGQLNQIEVYRRRAIAAREAIINQGFGADVELKLMYHRAYNAYVAAYHQYAEVLIKNYRANDRLRSTLMHSNIMMRKYQKQAGMCNRRLELLWKRQRRAANEELLETRLRVDRIGDIFQLQGSHIAGESCVHKVLLEYEAGRRLSGNRELMFLEYEYTGAVNESREAPQVFCPNEDPNFSGGDSTDLLDYPPRVLDDGGAVLGLYQPFSYYQLFRMLTDFSMPFELVSPVEQGGHSCDIRNSVNLDAYRKWHQFESNAAKEFADVARGTPTRDRYSIDQGLALKNEAYRKAINTLKEIFEAIDGCIVHAEYGGVEGQAPDPTGPPINPAADQFDPTLPDASRMLASCYNVAETFRDQALDNEAAVSQIIRALANMQINPPVSPTSPDLDPLGERNDDFDFPPPNIGNGGSGNGIGIN